MVSYGLKDIIMRLFSSHVARSEIGHTVVWKQQGPYTPCPLTKHKKNATDHLILIPSDKVCIFLVPYPNTSKMQSTHLILIPYHPMNQTLELKTDHKKGTAQITNCGIGSEKKNWTGDLITAINMRDYSISLRINKFIVLPSSKRIILPQRAVSQMKMSLWILIRGGENGGETHSLAGQGLLHINTCSW